MAFRYFIHYWFQLLKVSLLMLSIESKQRYKLWAKGESLAHGLFVFAHNAPKHTWRAKLRQKAFLGRWLVGMGPWNQTCFCGYKTCSHDRNVLFHICLSSSVKHCSAYCYTPTFDPPLTRPFLLLILLNVKITFKAHSCICSTHGNNRLIANSLTLTKSRAEPKTGVCGAPEVVMIKGGRGLWRHSFI